MTLGGADTQKLENVTAECEKHSDLHRTSRTFREARYTVDARCIRSGGLSAASALGAKGCVTIDTGGPSDD